MVLGTICQVEPCFRKNVDDGNLVTGLFLEKFAVVNPGGYTFEWASHSRPGNLLLAGVPFHRRTLHMCHQHRRVVGKLFATGDGRKDSRKGLANFFKVCQRLKAHERNNPSRNYWGFPTVPVKRLPLAVRVPDPILGAITPVAPVAAEPVESFALRLFTEPVGLFSDTLHFHDGPALPFLKPVMFVAEPTPPPIIDPVSVFAHPRWEFPDPIMFPEEPQMLIQPPDMLFLQA
ncbi:uncharacterized protein LOC115332831 [Ixodes scapularis]|uniref:uncharacterized protein LOC115332831 n=1 Tax=Ixodes scapularis TaxID=6945 RepID=UPI001C37EC72|nr:uncharacterized protein LOC115332831 [Ixodes scapularis]